jgi:predicted ATPase
MFLKNIKLSNFRTFEEIEIDLRMFNVLIGTNASGKSNFIQVIRFIKDIAESGLDSAISLQGGIEYARNVQINSSKDLMIEINFGSEKNNRLLIDDGESSQKTLGLSILDTKYVLNIEFYKESKRYKKLKEYVELNCRFSEVSKNKEGKFGEPIELKNGKIKIANIHGDVSYEISDFKDDSIKSFLDKFAPVKLRRAEKSRSPPRSLLELPLTPLLFDLAFSLRNISIYDIDPKLAKAATPIVGKTNLDSDGGNLAIILNNILNNKKNESMFSSLIRDLLPFIDKVTVKDTGDKSLITNLAETYSHKNYLPAHLLSDGTINITALVIALYFGGDPIIIEEPERNIHPYLISKIISMMKDVSERQKKQVIVTTHNPEVVKYAGIENILFVKRDERGFSKIYRPYEKDEVKVFLENDMGVDTLYIQDLL